MKTKILFRCDAGKVKKIGTGHLYRCIFLANLLRKRFNLKNSEIKFIVKSNDKYKIALDVLKENKVNFISYQEKYLKENSNSEINILKKNQAKVLIIDRWSKTNKRTIFKLKNYFDKIISIDDKSNHNYFDLKINSLIKKNSSSFKNLILPSYNYKNFLYKKFKFRKNIRNIFINLGGWDKNDYTKLILDLIKKLDLRLNLYLSSNFKKSKKTNFNKIKIIYFPKKQFYKKLNNSDLSIVSSGLVMFDSLFFKTPVIAVPQDRDQYFNAKRVNNLNANLIIKTDNIEKSFIYNFNNLYKNNILRKKLIKNSEKVINIKNMEKILEKLFNTCRI